jgi:predicted aldo/keto reductase-like oxidoreductase
MTGALMPNTNGSTIPLRQFGRHDVKISAIGFGGHHLGDAPDQSTAVRLVRQAVDGGITFFDNAGNITAARPKSGWAPV